MIIKYCKNCGDKNHEYKNCPEPVSSYGIILLKSTIDIKTVLKDITKIPYNINIPLDTENKIKYMSYLKHNLEFLVIQRKHTLGYIEFIRGRYEVNNVDGLIFLFQQMTQEEINNIRDNDFDTLWKNLWNNDNYIQEYNKSMKVYNALKHNKIGINLDYYTKNIKPAWNNNEWGFPKGRRNKNESDLECAKREFEEETGLDESKYEILDNIEPLVENLMGTDGLKYRHIYYLAVNKDDTIPSINNDMMTQYTEIGNLGYYTIDVITQSMFRPYHIDRYTIINNIFNLILKKLIN